MVRWLVRVGNLAEGRICEVRKSGMMEVGQAKDDKG